MFERYTEKARRVIFFSRYEASQFGSPFIETEHLLLGLLREDKRIATQLSRPDFHFEYVRRRIEELKPPRKTNPTSVDLPLSSECKRILAYAAEEAERLLHRHIGTEHLLLGMLRESDCLAAKLLSDAGVSLRAAREVVAQSEGERPRSTQSRSEGVLHSVEIRNEWFNSDSVRELGEHFRKFWWEKRQWVPRDALARRSDKRIFLHSGQPYDAEQAELVKGGWTEDHCAICWWKLDGSSDHHEGYTNGQDWLCTECHDRFVNPPSQAAN